MCVLGLIIQEFSQSSANEKMTDVFDRMCQKWFVKFPVGDFSLDGYYMHRPVVFDSG